MPNLFLLFSHSLTGDQSEDARRTLGVQDFISLPEALQVRWSVVPPEAEILDEHLQPVLDWLLKKAQPGDYLLVQGDFGMTYLTVRFAFKYELIPIYATTMRKTVETRLPDGTVRTQKTFKHVRYRKYQE